jgi:hypothetical protein
MHKESTMNKFTALTLACTLLSSSAWPAGSSGETVLLMNMTYAQGRWQAQPAAVLPCGGPSKPDSLSSTRSLYQLKNRDGKVLLQHYMANPRVLLVEDPRELAGLLKEMKFTLRVPINQAGKAAIAVEDVQTFEYFENARDTRTPSAVARFDQDKNLATLLQAADSARCVLVDPRTDRLPPLTIPPSTAITPDGLAALIRNDRESLIRWGLDNDLTPTQLRTLVSQNPKQLAELQLDKATIDKLLLDYEAAYRNRTTAEPR